MHIRIPSWPYEQQCISMLFPNYLVTPSSGNAAYYADYQLQHEQNPALRLALEVKTDLRVRSTGRLFIESVDASIYADGKLREVHVSNILSFKYDSLVILAPDRKEPPTVVLALVFSVLNVPLLIRAAQREWQGTPSSHKQTHTCGWLVPLDQAIQIADQAEELRL